MHPACPDGTATQRRATQGLAYRFSIRCREMADHAIPPPRQVTSDEPNIVEIETRHRQVGVPATASWHLLLSVPALDKYLRHLCKRTGIHG